MKVVNGSLQVNRIGDGKFWGQHLVLKCTTTNTKPFAWLRGEGGCSFGELVSERDCVKAAQQVSRKAGWQLASTNLQEMSTTSAPQGCNLKTVGGKHQVVYNTEKMQSIRRTTCCETGSGSASLAEQNASSRGAWTFGSIGFDKNNLFPVRLCHCSWEVNSGVYSLHNDGNYTAICRAPRLRARRLRAQRRHTLEVRIGSCGEIPEAGKEADVCNPKVVRLPAEPTSGKRVVNCSKFPANIQRSSSTDTFKVQVANDRVLVTRTDGDHNGKGWGQHLVLKCTTE